MKQAWWIWAGCFLGVVWASGLGACHRNPAVRYPLVGRQPVVTLVNLHPDMGHKRLYSVNYLQDGLIPRCTPVQILEVTTRQMRFVTLPDRQTYDYLFHKNMRVPVAQHLDAYFGTGCDPNMEAGLLDIDRQGIEAGMVFEGMSKQGVTLAIGYPPPHETPDLESNRWKYWRSRLSTLLVLFAGDRVQQVVGNQAVRAVPRQAPSPAP